MTPIPEDIEGDGNTMKVQISVEQWLDTLPQEVADKVLELNDSKKIGLLVGLNPSQVLAVMALDGPTQINAVAGSGKTRVLVQRIAYMLASGIKPGSILVTTFTKKAAEEMTTRLKPLVPSLALQQMMIGTTHSIGWKILAKEYKSMNHHLARAFAHNNNFLINGKLKIFAEKVKESIMKDRTVQYEVKQELRDMPVPMLLSVIGGAKNEGKDQHDFASEHSGSSARMEAYVEFYNAYERAKWLECTVDADDLLFLLWKLFKEHKDILRRYQDIYKYLLVDEAQDNNGLQYELFKMLAHPRNNIFIVGDDDQSMYGFRGARPDQFIYFDKTYPGVKSINLEDNYRSNPHILEVANNLIQNNTVRLIKRLKAHKKHDEECVAFTSYQHETEEAKGVIGDIKIKVSQEGVSPKDIAILYRTNAQSRLMEEQLILNELPYVIHGGITFYERKEVKDIISYLRLAINPHDDKSVDRVINIPSRYLGAAFKDRMKACKCSHWDAIHGKFRMESYMERGANDFIQQVTTLADMVAMGRKPVELVDHILDSFYKKHLENEGEGEDEGSSRMENINTLRFALERHENLNSFLDYIDQMTSKAKHSVDGVQLMTIHKSKGLEFKVVYVIGCGQGLLPHYKAVEGMMENPLSLEEERRLLYVAITRGEAECYLSSPGTWNGKHIPLSTFVHELGLPINEANQSMEELEVERESVDAMTQIMTDMD